MDLSLQVEGVGLWSPALPDLAAFRSLLQGAAPPPGPARPAPALLPPAERRRAPETVLLAVQAGAEACAMAGREPAQLPCVFACSQGDIATTDAMCLTLAEAPLQLSPTKFHNSVHNAPAGYWTIAAQCRAPSTALSARDLSVGAGLLEAAVQALDRGGPVLLVCYDASARGSALSQVVPHAQGFAAAFVLAPAGTGGRTLRLRLAGDGGATPWPEAPSLADLAGNPAAAALPLLAALALAPAAHVQLPASPGMMLSMDIAAGAL
jgi:hypothetical protein